MKPISKYRAKTMCRTLLGQKLAEALKDERPDSRKVQPLDFCNFPDQENITHEKAYTLNA
jgi:hypothetical protein